jgi:circadian clock protein KaiC
MEGNADRTDGIYTIGAVARMLGVPTQTLRAWEERYQQIVPARSEGGQRLYSRDQVDQLSVFHNASPDRPAMYLTTVSEPLEKILRYGQSLDFFDPSALGTTVIYEDLGRTLNEDGLAGAMACITELLKQNRPALVVIDSFRALQTYAADPETFRRFLHELAGRLSALPVTSFWVGEYNSIETSDAPELAIADAIGSLSTDRDGERNQRVLSVMKLRGSTSLSGKHAYRLSSAGIHVFPRMADPVELNRHSGTDERTSSGVPALDAMLSDGYYRGASTLVAGLLGLARRSSRSTSSSPAHAAAKPA